MMALLAGCNSKQEVQEPVNLKEVAYEALGQDDQQ
jgi:hypothetical protein